MSEPEISDDGYLTINGERVVGVFEYRTHPNLEPHNVKIRRGLAERAFSDWYVVIDNGSRLDEHGQWSHQWGHGTNWWHPDPEVQPPCHGTFDQIITPLDDAARQIVEFVKTEDKKLAALREVQCKAWAAAPHRRGPHRP